MTRYHVLAALCGLAIGFAISLTSFHSVNAANPPDPHQINADIYEVAGWPSPTLQTLNPVTQVLKAGLRELRWRWLVVSGCSAGNMRQTLGMAMDSTTNVTGVRFVEDAGNFQFTVRASCGVSFTNICGGDAIACLGRGFPGVCDIDASTTMATFYDLSQVSIWEHEFAGHCLETAEEGYCKFVSASCPYVFAPAPGYVSYMNTGPDSRYDWPKNDRDRWERVMYALQAPPPCGNPCWNGTDWVFSDGWRFRPNATDGQWFDPQGRLVWDAVDPVWNARYSPVCHGWYQRGHDGSMFCDAYGFVSLVVP